MDAGWDGSKQIIPHTPPPTALRAARGSLTISSLLPGLTDAYFHLFHPKMTRQSKRHFSDHPLTWVIAFDLLNSLALESPQINLS